MKIIVQLCACREFGSISRDNLQSLVYIALWEDERWSKYSWFNAINKLSFLSRSCLEWCRWYWLAFNAQYRCFFNARSGLAHSDSALLLMNWFDSVSEYFTRSSVHQASACASVDLLILTFWFSNFWCWCANSYSDAENVILLILISISASQSIVILSSI